MKNLAYYLIILLFVPSFLISQNLSTAPTTEAGMFGAAQGGSPQLNLVMMEIRSNPNSTKFLGETIGTPYATDKFIKSKLFYGEEAQGDFFVRYNALNSNIQIKKTNEPDEEPKNLYADKNVRIKYLNKELRFTTYINKKDETKNGYLSKIVDGDKYKLYHRLAVKYSEGKAAANSMVADIPSRFAHFEEYYYQKVGVDRIDYLSSKKSAILRLVDDKMKRERLKLHLKEENFDLNREDDLITIFKYMNTL
ncbi:hypothetical protein [Maribacter aestuarii]|uniref:hypothetical protein n=1 Tax=Maribacter aestuarii TaxID=1130723 RepID=UPI0025A5F3E3|nr:hypothetical protein [Maribacter aestuarii]